MKKWCILLLCIIIINCMTVAVLANAPASAEVEGDPNVGMLCVLVASAMAITCFSEWAVSLFFWN